MPEHIMVDAARRGERYLSALRDRSPYPTAEALAGLAAFDMPLQDEPVDPYQVLEELDRIGSPGTVGNAGGRYFGFVIGGALPAALGASVLAAAWDQNAVINATSPVAAALEGAATRWLLSVLGLPESAAVGFVTGATQGSFTSMAAARHALLSRAGWDVEEQGLFGAPEINVVVGEAVHESLLKGLAMLGLGRARLTRAEVDSQGRVIPDKLPKLDDMTLLCLQAGNVNSGAIDPMQELCQMAATAGAWVHVDGAFGLWANATAKYEHLLQGVELADSWSTDAHKWLNVPYDSGLCIVRDPENLVSAMAFAADYMSQAGRGEPFHYTPELSRRARGMEIWAALRSLGRRGLAEMIERNCDQARRMATALTDKGIEVLNDVQLNQILLRFGSDDRTGEVMREIQSGGELWAGDTLWHGKRALRISISSWITSDEDIDRSIRAIISANDTVK